MSEQTFDAPFSHHQLITDSSELIVYEIDAGFDRGRPDAVFYPESAADVSRLVRWARNARLPVIARGAGTGLSGGAVAERGGVIVEFARMNRILELNPLGRNGIVQPGVVNLALDTAAKKLGLYYPPDPSSGRASLLGGNIGENAGGPHCFKYGVTTNYITGLEAVLADGRIIRTGGQAFDAPELDLTGLIVGSEGTLALVTEASIRLIRNPPAVKTMMVSFRSDEAAGAAVSAIIAAGLTPATLEMMDQKVMGMIEAYVQVGLPVGAQAALIVEVDGYPQSLDGQVEEIAKILVAHGGYDLRIAADEEERQRIWYGRKSAAGAFSRLAPAFYLVDVTVPRSRLAETLREIAAVLARYNLETGHVFHAGDGNLHPCILCDPRNAEQMERVFAATHEIVAICIAKDGSITGEHGVGIEKRQHMPAMYTAAELAAMRDVKQAFDPDNLLNPGKILPDDLPEPVRMAGAVVKGESAAPSTAEEAAAILAGCTVERQCVHIASTKHPGRWPDAALLLSTHRLRGVLAFAPDDLYVTVAAGTPFRELADFLSSQGFQAPFAAPWPDATVGGLLASNLNAPLRMRYGGWRDNVLAVKAALPDGRIIRTGRPVVKNVAGYDLTKLFIGSQGTLGLIADVTLKLTPLPRLRRTLSFPVESPLQGVAWAQATALRWLMTAGIIIEQNDAGGWRLLFTVEGLPADVDAECEELAAALRQVGADRFMEGQPTATERWCAHLAAAGDGEMLVRVGVPPQHLAFYWRMLPEDIRCTGSWWIDVASGLLFVRRARSDVATLHNFLQGARQPALALRGYAAVLTGPEELMAPPERWGRRADADDIAQAIRRRWDPSGILI
ncbi:MAG: FAD-binding oxidoreductase [Caldilinea sp.]|nr:FAD-binding oxidoreductase [Caldilinea sp.]MDW8442848.1 FAD-linked oxidase C-terminal domain-containing protein [Caldilineaceae bacterium]